MATYCGHSNAAAEYAVKERKVMFGMSSIDTGGQSTVVHNNVAVNFCEYIRQIRTILTISALHYPHFKAHLFQDMLQGVHTLCSVNYAPWQ